MPTPIVIDKAHARRFLLAHLRLLPPRTLRMDPEFDRASRVFTIKNWWWEKEVDKKDEAMLAAIGDGLAAFGKYLEANEIRLGPDIKREAELAKAVKR